MFAYDLILIMRVYESTVFAVRDVLEKLFEVSGQKINESKSKLIFSSNTLGELKELLRDTLKVKEDENLSLHLEIHISHKWPSRTKCSLLLTRLGVD